MNNVEIKDGGDGLMALAGTYRDFAGGEKMSYVESHNDDVTTVSLITSTMSILD